MAAIVAAVATVYAVTYLMSPWPTPAPGSALSGPSDYARISSIVYALYSIPVAVLAALFLGVPLFGYMHRHGLCSRGSFIRAGAVMAISTGAACAVANHFLALLTGRELLLALIAIVVGAAAGALTVRAIAFRPQDSQPISSNYRLERP